MPEFHGPEKVVIRRYNDFVWLHERLAERFKGIFIPPLPEKSAVGKFITLNEAYVCNLFKPCQMFSLVSSCVRCSRNVCLLVEKFRFSAEFIELRQRALDVFLNRIANHPHLRSSEDFQSFLQADEELWVKLELYKFYSALHFCPSKRT